MEASADVGTSASYNFEAGSATEFGVQWFSQVMCSVPVSVHPAGLGFHTYDHSQLSHRHWAQCSGSAVVHQALPMDPPSQFLRHFPNFVKELGR